MIHGNRPHTAIVHSRDGHLVPAGGAAPESWAGKVARQQALLQKNDIRAIRLPRSDPTFNPGIARRHAGAAFIGGNRIIVVAGVEMKRQAKLFHVGQALSGHCARFGCGKSGQQQSRQDGDNGNDHEQLD